MLPVHPPDRHYPLHRPLHLREHLLLSQVSECPLIYTSTCQLGLEVSELNQSLLQHHVPDGTSEAVEEDV